MLIWNFHKINFVSTNFLGIGADDLRMALITVFDSEGAC